MTRLTYKSIRSLPRRAATQLAEALVRDLPKKPTKPVRLPSRRQLAERFGVSLPTVTAALRELQRRRLVYWVPGKGMFSGGLKAGGHRLANIGLLGWFSHVRSGLPAGGDTYRMYLLHDLMMHAVGHSCQITVIPQESDSPVDLDQLRHSNFDALLLKDVSSPNRDISELRKLGIPLLSDSLKFIEQNVGYVGYDNLALMSDVVGIFSSRGHQRIAYVGVETSSASQNALMRQAFFTAMVDAGLIYDYNDDWRVYPWAEWRKSHDTKCLIEHGARTARELLTRRADQRPTAIFTWQVPLADAIVRVAGELGLRVPEDVSIITDAIDQVATMYSTFVQPHSELACRLLDRIQEAIKNPGIRVRDDLRKQFVDRGSVYTLS